MRTVCSSFDAAGAQIELGLATEGEFLAINVQGYYEDCVCGLVEGHAARFFLFMYRRLQRLPALPFWSFLPGERFFSHPFFATPYCVRARQQ